MKDLIARLLQWTRALFADVPPGLDRTTPGPATAPSAPAPLSLPHTSAVGRPSGHREPACTCPDARHAVPRLGTFVIDMHLGKVGQVMGHEGPRLQLRPPAGGLEWEVAPDAVRAATDAERLSAKVQAVNARGRWGK